MPQKRLTEAAVAKLKPPLQGQVDYFDAHLPGLVLRVNYGGAKIWRALYYVKRLGKDGKPSSRSTTYKLGRYPQLSLKDARDAARQFLADPEKAMVKAEAQAAADSFKAVAEKFLKRHVQAQELRSEYEIKRILNNVIYPHWQDRPFVEIRRSDVADLLDTIEDNSGARSADMALAVIRKMMRWYTSRSDDYRSPVVPGMRRQGQNKRERWLDDDEIRALWAACSDLGTFGALVRILLITGQRRAKVTAMKWKDIIDGEWHIEREAREKNAPSRLRLPQMARDIIKAQPHIVGNPFVFAAAFGGGPFNSFSQRKAELDEKMPKGTKPWTLHDLRRTARALMTRAGVRVDVAELALGHSIKGIQGVYDDPGEYWPMIDKAVQAVADQITRILNPPTDNIVPLHAMMAN